MINFYLNRIRNNIMTLEEVPQLWRARVLKALEELEVQDEEILKHLETIE